jgi:hypothetical protein
MKMTLIDIITKDNTEIVKNILTSIAILVGGGWTFWRFVLQREGNSKIQFNVDLKVIGVHKDKFIVEVIAMVENKGLVRHYVNDFRFDLLYLSDKQDIVEGDESINKQVLFEKIVSKRYWIPPDWYYSFIDAGVTQNYTYTTFLPIESKYALVFAQFKYPDRKSDFHTSQKTFAIQKPTTSVN